MIDFIAGLGIELHTLSLSHWERVGERVTSPEVICARDFGEVGFGEFAVDAVNERSQAARIYKQNLSTSVTKMRRSLIPSPFSRWEKGSFDFGRC